MAGAKSNTIAGDSTKLPVGPMHDNARYVKLRLDSTLASRPISPLTERDQSFAEPVAFSSTGPADFRLPPTIAGTGFDLVTLRARRREETRAPLWSVQDPFCTRTSLFAKSSVFHISTIGGAACGKRLRRRVAVASPRASEAAEHRPGRRFVPVGLRVLPLPLVRHVGSRRLEWRRLPPRRPRRRRHLPLHQGVRRAAAAASLSAAA